MQIQVRCGCGEGNCPEWAIVELQGVVESQHSEICLQTLQIGRLCCSSSQNSFTFTVGYHELLGTKVVLKKPMLVMTKRKVVLQGDDGVASLGSSTFELEVIGIIRQKILFNNRPKALISKPQVREKNK